MRDISKLKALLDISAEDESRDELLSFLLDSAERYALSYCRLPALGGEGISSRSLSGISEHYRPDYSEKIKAVLRRARKPGVIS